LIKVLIAAIPIAWLVRTGAFDFAALGIFVERPALLGVNLAVFAIGLFVATLRWNVLLRAVDVHLPLRRAVQLQLIGMFFNVAIPGNVGGDVVKAVSVARTEPPDKRAGIYIIPVVERVAGLAGLVAMAMFLMPLSGSMQGGLRTTVLLLGFGCLGGAALLMLAARWRGAALAKWVRGTSRLSKFLSNVVAALTLMARRPKAVVWALLLSMLIHGVAMWYFWLLVDLVGGQDAAIGDIASVFPLGMLLIIVPITPSGFGIGHLAFEELLAALGLHSGATIFNVFLIGQIVPCLAGAIPYVALRSPRTHPNSTG
jgi:uncharacterized protein (TIRG00374 family)